MQELIHADGCSSLTILISWVLHRRDLLKEAIRRDAEALRILSSPALYEAQCRVEREIADRQIGLRVPRQWTRQDERRLNWIEGLTQGTCPPCRTARVLAWDLPRKGFAAFKILFRETLDEARNDDTAAVIAPILQAARDAYDRMVQSAHGIADSRRAVAGLDDEVMLAESHLNSAVSGLIECTKEPQAGDACSTRRTSMSLDEVNTAIITICGQHHEAANWTAQQFKAEIEKKYPVKKTSATNIKKTAIWPQLMEGTGRGRTHRPVVRSEDTGMLNNLISQQEREMAAESGTKIQGRRVASRD